MRRRKILLALLAFVTIIAIGRLTPDAALPATTAAHPRVAIRDETTEQIADLKQYSANDTAIAAGRNLFAYTEAPRPAIEHIEQPPLVAAPAQQPLTAAPLPSQPAAPQPPRFAYRYIGHFGPDDAPLAAFVSDGDVVVVRPGEKIGNEFVLRAIGVESAVIGFTNFTNTLTVPIGQ